MLRQAISKNSLLLALFAVVVAGSLALTEIGTREQREASLRKVKSKALNEVIPVNLRDNVLLDDAIDTQDTEYLRLKKPQKIYIARLNGKVTGFIFPTRTPNGYGGAINSIVGIDTSGNILGVRVISHAETPGLGDKIELKKSDWILSFNGKSLNNTEQSRWAVQKDRGEFDQFTGATITPRAVVDSIYKTLQYFNANKKSLLTAAANPQIAN
ncbi:MAG: electron transport complex subunit RsxG [Cellvibrionales bacterium]|nr:electron transport complex subunit RsxG [Cellvibrionales bacterium]